MFLKAHSSYSIRYHDQTSGEVDASVHLLPKRTYGRGGTVGTSTTIHDGIVDMSNKAVGKLLAGDDSTI